MTHDELLAKITGTRYTENGYTISDGTYGNERLQQALRAVVELHKPYTSVYGNLSICWECSSRGDVEYPCPTIEAIEKELK